MINSGWWAAWDTLPLRVFPSLIVDELIGNRSLTSGAKWSSLKRRESQEGCLAVCKQYEERLSKEYVSGGMMWSRFRVLISLILATVQRVRWTILIFLASKHQESIAAAPSGCLWMMGTVQHAKPQSNQPFICRANKATGVPWNRLWGWVFKRFPNQFSQLMCICQTPVVPTRSCSKQQGQRFN